MYLCRVTIKLVSLIRSHRNQEHAFVNGDNKLYARVLRPNFCTNFFTHSVKELKIVHESVNVKFLFINVKYLNLHKIIEVMLY